MSTPTLTLISKTSTTVTVRMNGNYQNYSFALDGVLAGFRAWQLVEDGQPVFYTVRFINLEPDTEYMFGIIDDESEQLIEGSEIPVTTDAAGGSGGNGGLSDGAIIGIIFGSIVLLAIIYYYSYVKYFNMY